MKAALYLVLWAVNALIVSCMAIGFGCEWVGVKLIPLQKLLTKKIEGNL